GALTVGRELGRVVGHGVITVSGGGGTVRGLVPGGFDLVITFLGMVGMTGWELAVRLRARDPDIQLIFITGWGMQEQDQARCRGLGISALLFKPVRPAELHATVQSALANPGRPPRAASRS